MVAMRLWAVYRSRSYRHLSEPECEGKYVFVHAAEDLSGKPVETVWDLMEGVNTKQDNEEGGSEEKGKS